MLSYKKICNMNYIDDCIRLSKVAEVNGQILTYVEAEALWETYSGRRCAQWLVLPETDEEIWEEIEYYFYEDD